GPRHPPLVGRARRDPQGRRRPVREQRLRPALHRDRRRRPARRRERARAPARAVPPPRGPQGARDARALGPHPGRARHPRRRLLRRRRRPRRRHAPVLRRGARGRCGGRGRAPATADHADARPHPRLHVLQAGGGAGPLQRRHALPGGPGEHGEGPRPLRADHRADRHEAPGAAAGDDRDAGPRGGHDRRGRAPEPAGVGRAGLV
ncbi:MAG: MBL-fold metallo-hydrolase superfamily, partial [uncultured Acidimicrobiales bacterium]